MTSVGLAMKFAGADWLERELAAAASDGRRSKRVATKVSPLGRMAADALGLAFDGLNRLGDVTRASWSDDRWIEVLIHREVSTMDGPELTRLVVACHDLGIRLAIRAWGRCKLTLAFSRCEAWQSVESMEAATERARAFYTVIEAKEPAA